MSAREAVLKLQQLYMEYNKVTRELVTLKSKLSEINEAKRYLEKNLARRIYREIASLVIEVTREEAEKYLSDEEDLVKLRIEKLEEERRRILEEIRRYEKILRL